MRPTHQQILDTVRARKEWDDRCAVWYDMAHDGIPRAAKPFPGAADMHYPLAADNIDGFKPVFAAPLMSTEPLASLVAKEPSDTKITGPLAQWFDYRLRQKANFVRAMLRTITIMLTYARGVLKIRWDAEAKRLDFVAIKPMHVIVPADCDEIGEAPWAVHVQVYDLEAFKRSRYGKGKSAEQINRLTGHDSDAGRNQEDAKRVREGITHDNTRIIVWEVYARDGDRVEWCAYCPTCPTEKLADWRPLDYAHGHLPFVDFPFEETEGGWLSPRGIPEIIAPFEAALNKTWNEKLDAMTYYNRPLFQGERGESDFHNITLRPGQVLPAGIQPVNWGQPPISFDVEMQNTRSLAEQRLKMPDFGIQNRTRAGNGEPRTAREISEISNLTGQNSDLRTFTFSLSLGRAYNQAWALCVQFDTSDDYADAGQAKKIEPEALKRLRAAGFTIHPAISSEDWNRMAARARKWQRYMTMRDNPFTDLGELTRSVYESDEPGAVERFFRDPKLKAANQAEDQAQEISILMLGYPAAVQPADDDDLHLQICVDFLQKQGSTGAPVDPLARNRIIEHMGAHLAQLNGKAPERARRWARLLAGLAQEQQRAAQGAAPPAAGGASQ